MHPFFDIPRPHLFAHRGASAEAPENTLPAFARAIEHGVRYLELDCHATRDGEIVVLHDAELERTTNGEGLVSAHSFAELERIDAGYRFSPDGHAFPFRGRGVRVPRFAEVLEAYPDARLNLEVKQPGRAVAEEVVRLIQRANAQGRVLLAAAEEEILSGIAALDPGTALGSSIHDIAEFVKAAAQNRLDSFKPRGHALQIPPDAFGRPLVTRELVEGAHALGLFVHVWTINDAPEMRRLHALGVDGVMSDDPRLLLKTLQT